MKRVAALLVAAALVLSGCASPLKLEAPLRTKLNEIVPIVALDYTERIGTKAIQWNAAVEVATVGDARVLTGRICAAIASLEKGVSHLEHLTVKYGTTTVAMSCQVTADWPALVDRAEAVRALGVSDIAVGASAKGFSEQERRDSVTVVTPVQLLKGTAAPGTLAPTAWKALTAMGPDADVTLTAGSETLRLLPGVSEAQAKVAGEILSLPLVASVPGTLTVGKTFFLDVAAEPSDDRVTGVLQRAGTWPATVQERTDRMMRTNAPDQAWHPRKAPALQRDMPTGHIEPGLTKLQKEAVELLAELPNVESVGAHPERTRPGQKEVPPSVVLALPTGSTFAQVNETIKRGCAALGDRGTGPKALVGMITVTSGTFSASSSCHRIDTEGAPSAAVSDLAAAAQGVERVNTEFTVILASDTMTELLAAADAWVAPLLSWRESSRLGLYSRGGTFALDVDPYSSQGAKTPQVLARLAGVSRANIDMDGFTIEFDGSEAIARSIFELVNDPSESSWRLKITAHDTGRKISYAQPRPS